MNNSNNYKDKLKYHKKSYLTGVDIVRVAAFAFAIVSWHATASGLSEYVFDSGWQSSLVSFGIQALLFVFNLKLPFYFNRISENSSDRVRKRNQLVIIGFYSGILLYSSFFSFVYISNYVVYEHQSGYTDDNTILISTYREILGDTDDYIKEDMKAMQILASKLLGELKSKYPIKTTGNSASLQELEDKLEEAKIEENTAKDAYDIANSEVNKLKKEMSNYAASINKTKYHGRQDKWQNEYNSTNKAYKKAVNNKKSKSASYRKAQKKLAKAQSAVTNYKESQDTVIAKFLQEMLKPSPSSESLKEYINELNAMIVDDGENVDIINDYDELVEATQTLTIVVQDYISLLDASGDASKVINPNSIKYLMEHVMDDIMIPDPKSKSFDNDYIKWRKEWEARLNTLENVIQNLPKFSENEKVYLEKAPIDIEILSTYESDDEMQSIDKLRRNKVSDINVIEKVSSLLFSRYFFTAWFSFALALFFDLASLLAGLFIYGIQKNPFLT